MKNRFSFINSKMNKARAAVVGLGSTIMAGAAQAQIDVAPLTTEISGGKSLVTEIALAVLGVIALVAVFRLIRRAM